MQELLHELGPMKGHFLQASWSALAPGFTSAAGTRAVRCLQVVPCRVDRPDMHKLPNFGPSEPSFLGDTWESVRRPARHNDEALTGTTRIWLRKLPPGRRPVHLCAQFPRLANLLAWHWRDPVLTHELLDDLLTDRRGGRAGFPRAIAFELRRLRDVTERSSETECTHGTLDALRRFWSRH